MWPAFLPSIIIIINIFQIKTQYQTYIQKILLQRPKQPINTIILPFAADCGVVAFLKYLFIFAVRINSTRLLVEILYQPVSSENKDLLSEQGFIIGKFFFILLIPCSLPELFASILVHVNILEDLILEMQKMLTLHRRWKIYLFNNADGL